MEPRELELRNTTYGLLRELGRAPTAVEVAAGLGLAVDDVLEGWRRLDAQHAIVLDGTGAALRMLHPFSAVPTGYRVRAADRWWYANCAWDAFGVCAALAVDGRIETRCPDCDEPLDDRGSRRSSRRRDPRLPRTRPRGGWWDDIVFT